MTQKMNGRRVAFLATDGVEQSEFEQPWQALADAGADLSLVSLKVGQIQAVQHDEKGRRFVVGLTLDEATADDFDALVIPGGVANPDRMRTDERAVRFVRTFVEAGKPVAAICHGPWLLVEADVVRGRTLTSWPSLRTDIRNAGGTWVDAPVQVDGRLVTSRKPDDIPQFVDAFLTLFTGDAAERALDRMVEQSFPASDPPSSSLSAGGAVSDEATA